MDAVKKFTKINTRLAEAREALRAVDEEQRRALADVKTAEAALADHFAQESVGRAAPARPAQRAHRRPQSRRAAMGAATRGQAASRRPA